MFNRIKILTLLQLGNSMKISKITNKKKFALNIFLFTVLTGIITAGCVFLVSYFKNTGISINMGMLTFIIFLSQGISIIVCTNVLMHSLYNSKDNAILLSYPAKHNEVFISKLIVAYIKEIKKNIFFLIPILVSFGVVLKLSVFYYIFAFIFFWLLPIIPIFLGALLSIPLMYVKRFIDKFPIIYLLLVVGILVLIFLGLEQFVALIPKPLRIVALYNRFVNGLNAFIVSANQYALFYNWFVGVLFLYNLLLNLLWIILSLSALIIGVYYISMPLYFKLASKSGENTYKKMHKKSNSKQKSTFFAFIQKELRFTFRNVNQVINNYFLILVMPILLFAINVVFSAIYKSSLGDNLVVMFNLIISLLLILSSNTQSATAITSEGGEIILLKTAPSNTISVVWAKLFVNFMLSTIFISISSIVINTSNFINMKNTWEIYFMLLFIDWAHILWSFQLDILHPQLRDYAETGKVDSSPNISMSMSLGLIISLVTGFMAVFFLQDNIATAWPKLLIIPIVFFVIRLFFFIKNLNVYYKRIEY